MKTKILTALAAVAVSMLVASACSSDSDNDEPALPAPQASPVTTDDDTAVATVLPSTADLPPSTAASPSSTTALTTSTTTAAAPSLEDLRVQFLNGLGTNSAAGNLTVRRLVG